MLLDEWIDSLKLDFRPLPELPGYKQLKAGAFIADLEAGMILRWKSPDEHRYCLVGHANDLLGVCDDCHEDLGSFDAFTWLPFRS